MKRTDHGSGPRVLLYSHDTYGLGHLRRNVSIASAIAAADPDISILCVTGSPRSHSFTVPSNFDIVKLPSSTKSDDGHYTARSLDISFERLVDMRSRILLETIRAFRPDLVLVDHAPAGMAGELRPALDAIRRELPACRLWLGLRDVIDAPQSVAQEWGRLRVESLLNDYYDRIFVYGVQEIYDFVSEYSISREVAKKLQYTGYVVFPAPVGSLHAVRKQLGLSKHRPLVLVQVGGGGDGDRLLKAYADAITLKPRCEFESVIVTGPLLSERKRSRLESHLARAHRAKVISFTSQMSELLTLARATLTMGGYNSVAESLAFRCRTLVAPRTFPRMEQYLRAQSLARHGLVSAFANDQPEPALLRARVEETLASPDLPAGASPLSLDGARVVAREIAHELLPLRRHSASTPAVSEGTTRAAKGARASARHYTPSVEE